MSAELKIVGVYADGRTPKFDTPITPKENFIRFMKREKPLWMPCGQDITAVRPTIVPDNVARGLFVDPTGRLTQKDAGGLDWFGVSWEYVPSAYGSMVRPGTELLGESLEGWRDVIKFPDLDALDWEGSARENAALFADHQERAVEATILSGLFERLISFMGFENAAMALIDEEQQGCVHELFDALCGFYDQLIERFQRHYHISYLCFHDDWGSQRAPFFSLEVVMEMIAPYLKRVVESCHSRGIYVVLHSCGKNEPLVPAMIAAGVDAWNGQPMNDKRLLLDKYGDRLYLDEPIGDFSPIKPPKPGEMLAAADEFIAEYGRRCRSLVCSGRAGGEEGAALYRKLYAFSSALYAETK